MGREESEREGNREIGMVFRRPRVEDGIAGRRRLDLERLQLLHEAVAQGQVVGKDELVGSFACSETGSTWGMTERQI